jgi:hypothetical protein
VGGSGGLIYARGGRGGGGLVGRFWLLRRLWAGSAESKNPALSKDMLCALGGGNFTQN